jgi:hypothetical protein
LDGSGHGIIKGLKKTGSFEKEIIIRRTNLARQLLAFTCKTWFMDRGKA